MTDPKPADDAETLPLDQAPDDAGTPHDDGSTFDDGVGYGD
ncbi:hypothetical protein [Mesorhizobium sp.]|nr:hypothetical protein [Mesorhizobium sp.]